MAHPNIVERQAFVQGLLDGGVQLTGAVLKEVATRFECSISAIRADIKTLTKDPKLPTIHTSHAMRRLVQIRDGKICQYCGSAEDNREYVVEHIVPAPHGPARPFNLVVACQACNVQKGERTWIPNNLNEILQDNPAWRQRILELAAGSQPTYQAQCDTETLHAKAFYAALYAQRDKELQAIKQKQLLVKLLTQLSNAASKTSLMASQEWHDHLGALTRLIEKEL